MAAVLEVPTQDINATKTDWTTTIGRTIGLTTTVHRLRLVAADNTMTETIHIPHAITSAGAEAEAEDEVHMQTDRKVEGGQAKK